MPKILVVDDDPDILDTLRYALEHEGYEVMAQSDGRAALDAARRQPPDAAILDVMLPGLNGYEVSRLLKQDMRSGRVERFPVVLLTARRVESGERQEFLTAWSAADATIWKPYDLPALLAQIRTLTAVPAGPVAKG
jgi:two-component system phosphate regulon response regulator PhoB